MCDGVGAAEYGIAGCACECAGEDDEWIVAGDQWGVGVGERWFECAVDAGLWYGGDVDVGGGDGECAGREVDGVVAACAEVALCDGVGAACDGLAECACQFAGEDAGGVAVWE